MGTGAGVACSQARVPHDPVGTGTALGGAMEALIALIVLVAGLVLERSRPASDSVPVRVRRD